MANIGRMIAVPSEPKVYLCAVDNEDNVKPGHYCAPCTHDFFVLECNESGFGRASINGRWFEVVPRMAYVVPAGDSVAYYAARENPRRGYFLFFDGARVGQLLSSAGISSESPCLPPEKFDEILDLMKKLYSLRGSNDTATEFTRTGYLYELLGVIARGISDDKEQNSNIERAAAIMAACYNTSVTIEDIAAEVGFNRAYFSTAFKKCKGVTPHEYLTRLRVLRAKEIFDSDSTVSVGEAAESVGLEIQNFSRIFKGITGKTPREYKAQAERNKASR